MRTYIKYARNAAVCILFHIAFLIGAASCFGFLFTTSAEATDYLMRSELDTLSELEGLIGESILTPNDYPVYSQVTNLSVTVGSNAAYPTINDAITALSRYRQIHAPGIYAEIIINENYVMAEQVVATTDLSWIVVRAQNNAEITVDRASMQTLLQIYGADWKGWVGPNGDPLEPWFQAAAAPWMAIMGGKLPIIGAVFTMNTTGAASTGTHRKCGMFVGAGAHATLLVGAGVKNADDRGLQVTGGTVYADGSVWDGAGDIGVRPANNSRVLVRRASIQNCGSYAVAAASSMVSIRDATLSGAGGHGLFAMQGAVVDAGGIIADHCAGHAIYAYDNAAVDARGATLTNAGGCGIRAEHNARVNAWTANLSNAGSHGAVALYGASVNVHDAVITNSIGNGVFAGSGGRINAAGAVITGSQGNAAMSDNGGNLNVRSADLTNTTGKSLYVLYGSFISARDAVIDPMSYNQNLNELTCHGAIFY